MNSGEIPTDYYDLLGIDANASQSDIRDGYRKEAKRWHPDRPNGNSARFIAISEAHETLRDPVTRAAYDKPQAAGPYLTPAEIRWQLDGDKRPAPVTVRLSRRGDDVPREIDVIPPGGEFWKVGDPTAVLEADDLYDFPIVPILLKAVVAGTHRDAVRFVVDNQAIVLPIVLSVARTTPPPPPPPPPPRPGPEAGSTPPYSPTERSFEAPRESAPRVTAPRILTRLFMKLGTLLAAVAFAASPFGVMAVFAPIFNSHQHDLLIVLIALVVGPGCFIWLCVGVVAIFGALCNFLTDW
jgi:DnaJ domain